MSRTKHWTDFFTRVSTASSGLNKGHYLTTFENQCNYGRKIVDSLFYFIVFGGRPFSHSTVLCADGVIVENHHLLCSVFRQRNPFNSLMCLNFLSRNELLNFNHDFQLFIVNQHEAVKILTGLLVKLYPPFQLSSCEQTTHRQFQKFRYRQREKLYQII